MLISSTPPSHPLSVAYRFRKVRVDPIGLAVGNTWIGVDVRSVPPPTEAGSIANSEFGAVSGPAVVATKLVPPELEVTVQPEGRDGAFTLSNDSAFRVWDGLPTKICLVNVVGPRLLVTLKVSVS